MRQFITLPLLVEIPSTTQSWASPTSKPGKDYVVRDLDIDPASIESIREESRQRYMWLDTQGGKSHMIDCTREQLLALLGGTYAPNPTQE